MGIGSKGIDGETTEAFEKAARPRRGSFVNFAAGRGIERAAAGRGIERATYEPRIAALTK